ncbi:DHA2 family efflux MFS transporter permease subunit [Corynebacterium poyangense]|uniref:DHA2 family efflux MFS transporter permease subunit n=1 Tax=Corynebacterium poyangense TaxID=2684405 RepID=A0A7H0SN26_9CORY|nr:MDR family MFS transporter [Corynebacterium poyangense]QNQ89951.1 DHA2 family efflux MFS transporter permease subunit [Corynebacterium poyangense]
MTTKVSESPKDINSSTVERDQRSLYLIIGALMLTMLMSSLGQTIFAAALPTIVGDLGGANHMSWVITAFLLGQTIAMPLLGKLGDQLGRKWLFIGAILLFMAGSLLGGLSQNMMMLITARTMQGVAGGSLMILSQAITADVTTARERGKYMGIMGSVFGVSSVLGPVLGGWFTDGPGWRWGLWLNIPLGFIAVLAIVRFLRLPSRPKNLTIDWLGTLTMAIATSCLVLFVTWGGNEYEWSSPLIISLIIATLIFAVIFIVIESKVSNPLIPLILFKTRNFNLTLLAGLAVGVFMFGTLAYMPTYLQMVHGMTPTKAGLMMIPMMLGLMGTSIVVGNLISRTGRYRFYPIIGMVITGTGLILMSTMHPDTPLLVVGIYFFVFGFGLGCTMQVLVLIVQNSFPLAMVGTATGTNNFFRQVGGCLGSALVGGLFTGRLTEQLQNNLPIAIAHSGQQGAAFAQNFNPDTGFSRLTPTALHTMPQAIADAIQLSYNDSLTPVFLLLCPLAFASAIVLIFIREKKLSDRLETITQDTDRELAKEEETVSPVS